MKGKERTNESEYCQSHIFWLVKMQHIKRTASCCPAVHYQQESLAIGAAKWSRGCYALRDCLPIFLCHYWPFFFSLPDTKNNGWSQSVRITPARLLSLRKTAWITQRSRVISGSSVQSCENRGLSLWVIIVACFLYSDSPWKRFWYFLKVESSRYGGIFTPCEGCGFSVFVSVQTKWKLCRLGLLLSVGRLYYWTQSASPY